MSLADYKIAYQEELPPVGASVYEYWLAGNGVFVRGRRSGVEAMVWASEWCLVRGLASLRPYCLVEYPPLPKEAVLFMLEESRCAKGEEGGPVEALFHIEWVADRGEWDLSIPPQERSSVAVKPLEEGEGSSYASALIEVHSHHNMQPFWSTTDDEEEQGFRLYAVIGDIFGTPTIRLRVGMYGYFMAIPASVAFDLPPEVQDGFYGQPGAERVRRVPRRDREWSDITLPEIDASGLWVPGDREEERVGNA